eukprot:TRINITY_DN23102_c1_g1_i2.p1 TRINITY_DN23102_c1_g1~~TRINITY_DN23102_c1_g1_i2.p1  ORF type:complete len:496 (-),score=35.34 TRINITY_DN23102_c1_g1_i2:62-1444(-)
MHSRERRDHHRKTICIFKQIPKKTFIQTRDRSRQEKNPFLSRIIMTLIAMIHKRSQCMHILKAKIWKNRVFRLINLIIIRSKIMLLILRQQKMIQCFNSSWMKIVLMQFMLIQKGSSEKILKMFFRRNQKELKQSQINISFSRSNNIQVIAFLGPMIENNEIEYLNGIDEDFLFQFLPKIEMLQDDILDLDEVVYDIFPSPETEVYNLHDYDALYPNKKQNSEMDVNDFMEIILEQNQFQFQYKNPVPEIEDFISEDFDEIVPLYEKQLNLISENDDLAEVMYETYNNFAPISEKIQPTQQKLYLQNPNSLRNYGVQFFDGNYDLEEFNDQIRVFSDPPVPENNNLQNILNLNQSKLDDFSVEDLEIIYEQNFLSIIPASIEPQFEHFFTPSSELDFSQNYPILSSKFQFENFVEPESELDNIVPLNFISRLVEDFNFSPYIDFGSFDCQLIRFDGWLAS